MAEGGYVGGLAVKKAKALVISEEQAEAIHELPLLLFASHQKVVDNLIVYDIRRYYDVDGKRKTVDRERKSKL